MLGTTQSVSFCPSGLRLEISLKKETRKFIAAAKSLQSCPTLCDPTDGSPPGSPVPEILQARTLEWVAISFSSAWKWKVKVKSLSRVQSTATPWTAAFQAPPSMGFSRQAYWSGVPLPSPHVNLEGHNSVHNSRVAQGPLSSESVDVTNRVRVCLVIHSLLSFCSHFAQWATNQL